MFSSTDHNLNDPNRVIELNLGMDDPFSNLPKVINIKKEEYDLTKIKDPNTIYVIIDTNKNEIYKGDLLISSDRPKRQYLIGVGTEPNEYILYLNDVTSNYDRLVPICRYDNIDVAVRELHKLNHVGSHHKIDYQIYLVLIRYIKKEMSLHELILAILVIFGHGKKSKFQELIQTIDSFHLTNLCENPDSTKIAMQGLRRLPNELCQYYTNLYDLLGVRYNCFRGCKYHKDEDALVLEDEVKCVKEAMNQSKVLNGN